MLQDTFKSMFGLNCNYIIISSSLSTIKIRIKYNNITSSYPKMVSHHLFLEDFYNNFLLTYYC